MTKIAQHFSGVGSLLEVSLSMGNQEATPEFNPSDVKRFYDALICLASTDDGRQSAMAMIAAFLNGSFRKDGWLWTVSDTGGLDRTYHALDKSRNIIADLMGLPADSAK